MCCDAPSAPSSDPQIGAAAAQEAQTGADWLNFAKDQFADSQTRQDASDALTEQVTDAQLETMDNNNAWAKQQQDRQTSVFQPLQDEYVQQAKDYGSQANQDKQATQARADVMNSAATTNAASARSMASMGINPNSGRWAGTQRAQDLSTAVTAAGAQNTARQAVRDKALDLTANAINIGNGVAANTATAYGLGTSAGNSAAGNQLAADASQRANVAAVGQGYGGAMSGYAGQAGTLNSQYNSQIQAWGLGQQAGSASSAGIGNLAGMLGSTGIKAWSMSK
ncbi:hypothetical protein PQR33_14915 [Paraburkholderia sediminicola]|uniref:hypothetical protein n=1 Tax=Paraburkholderia sediminicola TaxID=458836 RepID=UPI0038BDF910